MKLSDSIKGNWKGNNYSLNVEFLYFTIICIKCFINDFLFLFSLKVYKMQKNRTHKDSFMLH